MATKKNKIIISKHFVSSFTMTRAALAIEYIVEAKPARNWVRVGGPFLDVTAANNFASQYSASHQDVEVQVVIFQR